MDQINRQQKNFIKNFIFGYVRAIEKEYNCSIKLPAAIIYLFASFYYLINDEWDPNCLATGMSLKENMITVTSSENNSALLVKEIKSGIHHWKFKMTKCTGSDYMIGIWKIHENADDAVETYFTNGKEKGYAYMCAIANMTSHSSGDVCGAADYGVKCKTGDIIEMHLNFNDSVLSFSVNGIDLGIAEQNIEKVLYRAAVYMYNSGDAVELLEYHCKYNHD
eukprot:307653_1